MKKIIQTIIDSIKTRKLLKQQYLNIKVLSNEKDFQQNLETYNLILIFNKKSSNWSLEKINERFNYYLMIGIPPIDLYMKFIIDYIKENQFTYMEMMKFAEKLNIIGNIAIEVFNIQNKVGINIESKGGFL
ncbi:hypothetical protein NZD85_05000 [Empedobacter stercoris]|uniref:hypothetical protein n=1 Tax=Empedobacter stercoris TaxID=1628248 RepID=UPI0021B068C0|nr:hypothetical protein [Empedobacter stercoris]UWX67965.1 hypothetical protein NZD85_05000 [Empedobacter stercoris]